MKILLKKKSAYGNILYYPMCSTSKMLLSLIKRDNGTFAKTLLQWQIDIIKENGWTVEIEDSNYL